jgi:diguanylate cyclase (GGDEF)-like protein
MVVLVIGFAFQACISALSLINLKQSMLRDRTAEVKHLLETAYSTVAFYHDQASKGLMTDEDARKAAKDAVRAMHYDNNNYFFIWDLNGVGVAHGSHPEWEGRNLLKPPDSVKLPVVSYMVARLIEVCKSDKKEGVTTYRISKFGRTEAIDKIAYTRLFVPWGWSIGTGAYVDDIDATFRAQAFSLLLAFTCLIALASTVTFVVGLDLSGALTRLSARVASIAKGELDGGVPETERRDEVGVMARALLVLRDNSREAVELRLDNLTGLPNRKLLMDRLKQAMAASERSESFGGLMLLDMDKFKTLNDTQGHDIGDILLKGVAGRLLTCVRECDTVARLGGDEFVVFVVNIGEKEEEAAGVVETIGEKILAELNKPFELGSITYSSSASIGLTLFKGNGISPEDILKQADLAMYKSKDTGRNTCRFFDPNMEETVRERAALEADLRRAIAEDEFQLYYQPLIGNRGQIMGAESLIRWNSPERGLVPPDAFIPQAEECGLIVALGQWVLETACKQIAAWSARPETAHFKVSVNVSAREFQQAGFVQQLLGTLAITGANPYRLVLELTESMMVHNMEQVIEKMLALQARGVSFSLDDFGTGYSSLSYMKRMPLNQVKIDRSFVRDLLTDPNDEAIARMVVTLSHALGCFAVAEGVETAEQLCLLSEFGCDAYQGYFFSRPLPLEAFEQFVQQSSADAPLSPRIEAAPYSAEATRIG